jgi:hypothetical protein
MNTSLPIVALDIQHRNPDWKIGDDIATYQITSRVECTVLTLNINSGTMRIRPPFKDPYVNTDVPIGPFFEKYKIVEK